MLVRHRFLCAIWNSDRFLPLRPEAVVFSSKCLTLLFVPVSGWATWKIQQWDLWGTRSARSKPHWLKNSRNTMQPIWVREIPERPLSVVFETEAGRGRFSLLAKLSTSERRRIHNKQFSTIRRRSFPESKNFSTNKSNEDFQVVTAERSPSFGKIHCKPNQLNWKT